MAIDLGALALQIGGDFTVNDNKKQQEQLEERFKELQDNKQLYRALATARYSKDMERYYKKVEANDKIESAYAKIEKENMTPEKAAYEIVMATPSLKDSWVSAGSGEHGEKRRNQILKDVRANFKHKEANIEIGVDAPAQTKKWYEFSRPEMELTAPKQKDYFQDPKYWGDLAKEIRAKETGPLQKQILKMLGKEPAEVDLDTLEQKAGTDIEEMLPKAKIHKSTGIGRDEDEDAFDWSDFLENKPKWIARYNTLIDKITWDGLSKKDHFLSWMATNNLLGANTEANFTLSENDTKIDAVGPAATAMLNSYKAIYHEVVKSFDARTLASMGVDITEISDNVSVAEVNKVVQRIIEQRAIKESFTKGTDTDFISILPMNMADADGVYTTAKGDTYDIFPKGDTYYANEYHKWLKSEAKKIEERWNVTGVILDKVDPVNKTAMAMAYIQNSIENGAEYKNKFQKYFDNLIYADIEKQKQKEKEKKDKIEKENENKEDIIHGDLKDGPQAITKENGEKGMLNKDGGKFISWKQLEEDGIIERVLEKHPHLKEHYDEWKATQSEDNIDTSSISSDTSSVNEKIKHRNINTDEKEEVIIPTDNNEETIASGVGSKPWLFSNETFNPDFDTSSIDMDKMYTVGTEANDYLKAKNLYEREQRKKKSILNKFFN